MYLAWGPGIAFRIGFILYVEVVRFEMHDRRGASFTRWCRFI
jgi:hypothetical protein